MNYNGDFNLTFGKLTNANQKLSFTNKINALTLLTDDFMFIRVVSTCDVDVTMLAGGVYQLTEVQNLPMSQDYLNPSFVREFVQGIDQRVEIFGMSTQAATVYACPYPAWMDYGNDPLCQAF